LQEIVFDLLESSKRRRKEKKKESFTFQSRENKKGDSNKWNFSLANRLELHKKKTFFPSISFIHFVPQSNMHTKLHIVQPQWRGGNTKIAHTHKKKCVAKRKFCEAKPQALRGSEGENKVLKEMGEQSIISRIVTEKLF
jgi:hypothetical protein